MLIPPDNFGMVEPGFYRCSKLEADHLPFLETLQLKLLVLLDVAKPPRTLKLYLQENHVDLYNLGGLKISNHQNTGNVGQDAGPEKKEMGVNNGLLVTGRLNFLGPGPELVLLEREPVNTNDLWMIIEKNLLVAAIGVLLDRTKHPVLIVDSSLALVGVLRKIQKWNFNSIVNEYRMYTGNASKISYNVEVFLELVQLELVPAELDPVSPRRKEEICANEPAFGYNKVPSWGPRKLLALALASPAHYVQTVRLQRNSVDDTHAAVFDDEDAFSLGDYEDDIDDELLLASPQIPANLLRLVEQRKTDLPLGQGQILGQTLGILLPGYASGPGSGPVTGFSPEFRRPSLAGTRSNSIDPSHLSGAHPRRRSSVESRHVRVSNTRFRDPQYMGALTSPRRASLDTTLRQLRLEQSDEFLRLKARFDYHYYRPMNICADVFNVIKVRIPPEHCLAPWFVAARDFWQRQCVEE